jgi:pimeloyl-ACP methyl ester carboxylesterase
LARQRSQMAPLSDVRSAIKLTEQAVVAVTDITEAVHQSVYATLGLSSRLPGPGITGFVYGSIRTITRLVGRGFDHSALRLAPLFQAVSQESAQAFPRQAVLAALNGVMGDRLAQSNSDLATPMGLFRRSRLPPSSKVVILIHGLCMNDLQWRTGADASIQDHGLSLEAELGFTPVYLRYNTGLSIEQNGRELAKKISLLQSHWGQTITEIAVVGHSMGGLVARHAIAAAHKQKLPWLGLLKKVVFLGTPHLGAPLEKAGHWIDMILGSTAYSAPFVQLTQLRSQGIRDLRHGMSKNLPWPDHLLAYTIAACTASKKSVLLDQVVGDGLVPLKSSQGFHSSAEQIVFYQMNHIELLRSQKVAKQLVRYLS